MKIVFETAIDIISNNTGLGVLLIILSAIVALIYLFLPIFTQCALIQAVAHMRIGHKVTAVQAFSFGFSRFLQLFEYSLLVKTFGFVGIATEAAFVLRNLGVEAFVGFLGWIFLFFFIIGLFLTLLFTYSEYYIVIDKKGVFNSMLASGGLVIRQLHHTVFMLLLMTIIGLRIVINIVIALLVPALVIAPIFLFASFTLTAIGVVVGAIIGLVALYFGAYFMGVFHIFATAVWTFTFLELTTKENKIDLRGEAVSLNNIDLRDEINKVQSEKQEVENGEGEQAL